jgi:hypothetical protein
MSEDWGADNDLLGWHKWKLGWLDDSQVGCASAAGTTEHVLTPLAEPGTGGKLVFVPVDSRTGYAVELRTQAGNDDAICKTGVLIYKVDATVDTGRGPITVIDSTKDSGGCTRSPNVHAELSDAAFSPGQYFKDLRTGIRITVAGTDSTGNHQVYVTRDRQAAS